jgi:hypothetical protein
MSDARFSDTLLAQIKDAVPISELIGQHVVWDKGRSSRGDFWACCPFHNESGPSFHADDRKAFYKCFVCGDKAGDHFNFLMQLTGCDFPEAVRQVAEMGGVSLPDRPAAPSQPRQEARPSAPAPEAPPEQEGPPAEAPEAVRVHVKGYRYTDGDGNALYEVIRDHFKLPDGSFVLGKAGNPKKTFWQRRPAGRGGYITGLGDVAHTIYRRQAVEIAIAEGKTILLPEGEKDVETVEEWGFVGATNSGGAQNWSPALAAMFAGADVVILGDDDEAGRKRVETIGMSLRGLAKRIRAIGSWGGPKDVTDWKEAGHTADELSGITGQLPDWRPSPPVSAFNATHIAEVEDRRKHRRHDWLVHDFIESGGVCSFSGGTQAGKTFAVTELAFCISRGKQFFGRDVKQGLVVYQVGEGELGFEKRLEGYCIDRGIDDRRAVPLIYLPKKINLFVDDKDTVALIDECRKQEAYFGIKLQLLVIDTFNKATRGANEISGQDMGKVINNVERLSAELDCTVILIDHVNKSGDLRGHGSKSMDVTNTVKVVLTEKVDQNGRKIRRMVLDKNKDGENGQSLSFVLRQVVTGEDEYGRQETTCVVEPPDGNEDEIVASGRLPPSMAFLLRMVRDTADIEGESAPPELVQVPPGRNVAKWEAVQARARKQWTFTASEAKAKDKEMARMLADAGRRLLLAGYIGRDNDRGLIWWTGKEDRPRQPQGASKPADRPKPSELMTPADMEVPF